MDLNNSSVWIFDSSIFRATVKDFASRHSYRELATRSGISHPTAWRIANTSSDVSVDQFLTICRTLKCNPMQFFGAIPEDLLQWQSS